MRGNTTKGFTLLELMIVVAIIALLASLAYNNYSRYAFRSRRVDGQNLLLQAASAEERFYTNYNQYTATITGSASSSLQFKSDLSEDLHYQVTAAVASGGQTYTLTATPPSADIQAKDKCGNLIIDSTGAKSASPGDTSNGACW